MANINIQTTRTAMPRCYCYSTPTISEHDGWVKIGYTEQDDVEDRIRQQLQTAHIPHHTEWSDVAVFADGRTYFRDSDFHAYLKKHGIERMKPMPGDKKQPEWFRISGDDSFSLYSKFRRTKGVMDTVGTIAYELRAEQEQAVSQTFDYFMSHEKGEFLWNAKPRFGKTLATYDLCKRLQATKGDYACNILIVTNRPAIANSWYEDFVKFIGTESGFRFVSEVSALKGKPFVMSREEYTDSLTKELADCIEFVSLQDLKGSLYFGGQHDKLKELINDEELDAFLQSALAKTLDDSLSVDDLVALTLEVGKYGVQGMADLDTANTSAYGNPEITSVDIGVRKNPAILISGHDLKDLEMLLEQTMDTGVDVYTHSEMLPAHYYPFFKKYPHFAGNYGNAWWKQKEEFESFNGPVLMTTNCIVPPKDSYKDRLWTTGAAGYPGCKHIDAPYGEVKDFSPIIEQAKKCPPPTEIETGSIIGGFAHEQVFALADTVVEAVKSGAIRKFVVMAGCDGRAKSRSYYQEFAEKLPKDTVILTAGCAKYKYNKLNLGDIGGIPRVLDAGQCNDSYSLALIALKLKEVFGLDDVNDLPIAYNIAWYEQKAVIVLLALLYLGVKNIHLGPTLPAFLSPNVAKVLVDSFGIAGITTVDDDMRIFSL